MSYSAAFIQHPSAQLATAGQPSEAELIVAKAAGLRCVINLRPLSESAGYDEAATAAKLGLSYQCLPIAGPQDFSRENVARFDALLAEADGASLLVHCASGNRVGALFALRAAWLQGKDTETALVIGQAHGLTKLVDGVRSILQQAG